MSRPSASDLDIIGKELELETERGRERERATEREREKEKERQEVSCSNPSATNIKHVPNGGLWAWLQVVSSFFLFMNTWGVINTFGTYQTYYETGLLSSSSPSAISWIGSVQATLLLLVGSFTGPIYDAGYARTLVAVGTVLVVFGTMMLSLCTHYYQVFLTQAICVGVGTGCLFIPCVAVLSTYWSTRLATAVGFAAAGSSVGGVVYPVVFHRLQPVIGFPWTVRVLGFIALGTLAISNAVIRVRVLPAGRRKMLDMTAWTEVPYIFFVLGNFVGLLGLYVCC
jgi:MFS family permease